MQSAYGKPLMTGGAWGEELPRRDEPPPPPRLPPGAVDAETFAKARREWEAELHRVQALHEQKMTTTNKLHAAEIASLRGEGRTRDEAAQAMEAAAREERIELLKRQVGRRMMNRDLTRGWQCWLELWEAKTYALSRLRQCAQRLKAPELAEAFGSWLRAWEAVQQRRELEAAEQRAKSALGESETLQEEVERLRRALAQAEDDKEKALERQLVELAGSAEERLALADEKAKEERVELLRRQIGRRMMNQGLVRGWTAWHELWSEKTYLLQRIRDVGNRFRAPEKSAAFAFWRNDWRYELHEQEKAELERQSKSLEAQLRRARFEAGQAELVKVAHEEEIARLREEVKGMSAASKDKSSGLSGAAALEALKKQNEDLAESQRAAEAEAAACEQKLAEAEEDAARQRKEDKKLLERLLAEQRKSFETQLDMIRAEVEAEKEAKAREERIELLRRQVGRRMMNRDLTRGWTAWFEYVSAKAYAMNRLREVGNRFRAPELANAFEFWEWYVTAKAQARRERGLEASAAALANENGKAVGVRGQLEAALQEVEALKAERGELREKLNALDGGKAEAERLMQEQLEREKHERVELLRRQVGRRMMNQGIANGWQAWIELWEAKTYAMNRLREVSNRFRSPELANAFQFWEWYVTAKHQAREMRELRTQAAGVAGEAGSMAAQLESLRREMERRLAEAEQEKEKALQRQLVELTGSAESRLAMEEERAREERIELLRRQVGRRMMNRDLTLGWAAWLDLWEAKTYAMNRLREVGNRLRSPELAVAFTLWAQTWEREKQAAKLSAAESMRRQLEAERAGISNDLEAMKEEYEERLRKAEAARLLLLEKVALLGGSGEEAEELLRARAEQEKEERVQLLRRQIGRRMMNQGMVRGWTAWNDLWRARREALTVLRLVGKRFKAPELAMAFEFWAEDVQLAKQRAAERMRLAELRGGAEAAQGEAMTLQEKVEELQRELVRQKKEAVEETERALKRQLVELTGSAEELAALAEEKSKEERIELLRRQSMRRMLNKDLALGWQCWFELWDAKTYAMNRLRDVGNRFRAPELANAFRFWGELVLEARRSAQFAELERQSKSLEHQLRQARFEVGQANLIRIANSDEILALKMKLGETQENLEDRDARLARLLGYEREADALRALQQAAIDAQKLAEERRIEAEEDNVRQREEDKKLLEKLLAEQRSQFEKEQEHARKQLKRIGEERKEYEDRITELSKSLAEQQASAETTAKELQTQVDALRNEVTKLKRPPPVKKKEEPKAKPSPLGNFDIDEGPDAPPISQQLADALRKNSTRVIDLFRSWDADGDGEVTRKEFHKAMPNLGLDVPKESIDELFTEWDKDGGGALNLKELQKILSQARVASPATQAQKATTKAVNAMAATKALAKLGKK